MADIDNCDGSNFLRRACDAGTGGGGGGGGSAFNESLTNGDGIGILDYDGSVAKTIAVNSSVVRNTSNQVIAGGLTIEKLTSNGPITGQGLDISGIFSVDGDGSIGGSSPATTNVIAWNGAKWAPATAGGAASSSNLDLGYALNQSLRTSDEGQLSKLDVTGVTGLLSSGNVGIGTTNPQGRLEVLDAGVASDVVLKCVTDDQNPYGLMVSNDTYSTSEVSGFGVTQRNDGSTRFFNDNSSYMTVSTDGTVGIGTTAPQSNAKLEVLGNICLTGGRLGVETLQPQSAAEIYGTLSLNTSGQTKGLWFGSGNQARGYLGAGEYAVNGLSGADFGISSAGGQNLAFGIGATEKMRISSDGRVGIGTVSPTSALELAGDATIDARLTLLQSTASKSGTIQQGVGGVGISALGANNPIFLQTAGAQVLNVTASGDVGIGTISPASLLELAGTTNPELRITDTDPGSAAAATFRAENSSVTLGAYSDDPLYLVVNNSTKMTVTAGGDVGIGTTSPQSQLNVAGSSSSSNGSQLRLSQGSAVNKRFNLGYHTGAPATQNVDYGKIEVYNASEPGGAKYMPLSLQSAGGSVVIGSTISKGLLGVSGDTYSQRVFLTGAGGSWGQLGGETLSQGDGISAFSFDALGAGALTVGVDSSVLRTGDVEQTIHGDRTFTGTITIGNLNVTGSQNIVTTNQLVSNGPTFTLNTGVGVGVNSYDIGWVGQRGSSLNVAVLWKEDQDQFELINTDGISGGAAYPDFAVSGYEGLKVSNLKSTGKVFVKTEVAKGDLSVSGSTYSQDIYTTGAGGSWERISSINDQSTSFNTPLSAGSSIYTINFPKTFGAAPVVNASLQNSAGGAIVPHMISGVGTSSYSVIFGSTLADSNYSINTSARPSGITTDGTVTQSFSTALTEGVTTQTISYPSSFGAIPYVNVTIEGSGSIVPYYISGVSTTNYDVVFGAPIPANNKIHTFAVR